MSEATAPEPFFDVAVVGMAGRFPGARNLAEFWRNLREGVESIRFHTPEELEARGVPRALAERPDYVPAASSLDGIDLFDSGFFGLSPRDASVLDPQHRVFLELCWEAFEDAGYDPGAYPEKVGVFAGAVANSYLFAAVLRNPAVLASVGPLQAAMGNQGDYLVTRASYKLDLKGPSINVQTTCSTSLVAVHLACQSLIDRHCSMALAGGVAIRVPQSAGYLAGAMDILSPDGHCRPFDASARGTVFGEGAGVVLLKRLSDAIADGDGIRAVIRSSAVNNDGALKLDYAAPSVEGQAEVIGEALAVGQIDPRSLGYVEAHGTGTPLGDPIEVAALTQAFRAFTPDTGFCALGSVKSNLGHLETAAGIAGLIKTVLALEHGLLPPSLNFRQGNPEIDFAQTPFYVNDRLAEWVRRDGPRRAGVSSFGMGGTNAHVIVEEAPRLERDASSRPWQLLLLSARSGPALEAATRNLREFLASCPDSRLADAAFTSSVGRRAFGARRAIVCRDAAGAAEALERLDPTAVASSQALPGEREVAFLFPGQGSQYPGMARELYAHEPVFREELDRCCAAVAAAGGPDLREALHPSDPAAEQAELRLQQTALAQPALFAVEYSLAKLWASWGVAPSALIGHSVGEFVAACLAGVMSPEDALRLVVLRGELMQSLPPGSMLAVSLSEAALRPELGGELALAAVNAPGICTVSGPTDAIAALEEKLRARDVGVRRLHTSHAFHSPMMDPIVARFADAVGQVELRAPEIPYLSNATGTWATPEQATDPRCWARQLRECVRFADGLAELCKRPAALLEVGPGDTLCTLALQQQPRPAADRVIHSLPAARERGSDLGALLRALGRLWVAGVSPDWRAFYGAEQRRRVSLPTYPFERQRHWVEPVQAALPGEPPERPAAAVADTRVDRGAEALPPRDELERQLLSIWRELLGTDAIGIHDNFFALGGHSLTAGRMSARIQSAFSVAVPLKALFDAPTVAQLAALIAEAARLDAPLEEPAPGSELAFWSKQLDGLTPLELPCDRPRPPVASGRCAARTRTLPAALVAALRALGAEEQASLFATLLAGFQALLARAAGRDDVAVGTPVAGRASANTLVLRTHCGGDPSFRELLRRARETSLAAFAHQDLPFEKLALELSPEPDPSRHPLCQVMFRLSDEPEPGVAATDLDLDLRCCEASDGLSATAVYAADLFDPERIDELLLRFEQLFEAVAGAPDRRLSELDLRFAAAGAGESKPLVAWEGASLPLARRGLDERRWIFEALRSVREFSREPIELRRLGEWLFCLSRFEVEGLPKYQYASGGGLYPVQTYLAVRPGRIEGLPAGAYYYDPRAHRLVALSAEGDDAGAHAARNRSVSDAAAFSVFLVADLAAIEPMYGELAAPFCLLEAGYMGELLMSRAPESGLGLCPVAGLDFERIRSRLALGDDHVLVHSLLGGGKAAAPDAAREARFDAPPGARAALAAGAQRARRSAVLGDALERFEFKLSERALRSDLAGRRAVALPGAEAARAELFQARRSEREFLTAPIALERLGDWLGCLAELSLGDGAARRYPSLAGGHPVEVYLCAKPGRVEGLGAGAWRYDPRAHRLVQLSEGLRIDRALHVEVNRECFDASALSLFLVADPEPLAARCGELARDLCALEAGYLSQLLMLTGPAAEIGVCPIGTLDFSPLRAAFGLSPKAWLIHAHLAGRVARDPDRIAALEPRRVEVPRAAAASAAAASPPESLRVPGADGLSLRVLKWGAGPPPCLLVHGFGHDALVWEDVARELAVAREVFALELRGHGDSDRDPQQRYDPDSLTRDLESAVSQLGLDRFTLVGHSLGGQLAIRFAQQHPRRLRGLVLVDSGPELEVAGVDQISSDEQASARTYRSVEEYARVLAERHQLGRPELSRRMASRALRLRPDGSYELKRDPTFRIDPRWRARGVTERGGRLVTEELWRALERIDCATLVVRGVVSSVLSKEVAQRMVAVLPRGELAEVPRAGHGVMIDNPEGLARVLASFLRARADA